MAFLSIPGDEEKRAQMTRSDPSAASDVGSLYRDSPGTRSSEKPGFLDDSKEYLRWSISRPRLGLLPIRVRMI